jgi:hypothetical protein
MSGVDLALAFLAGVVTGVLPDDCVDAEPVLIDHTHAHKDNPSTLDRRRRVEADLTADLKHAPLT